MIEDGKGILLMKVLLNSALGYYYIKITWFFLQYILTLLL
jgi:hypothetical protein